METIKVKAFEYDDRKVIILNGENLDDLIHELDRINKQIKKAAEKSIEIPANSLGAHCIQKYGYEILLGVSL